MSFTYITVAVAGVASGFLLSEFGSRYPVETVLVVILICGVATLCWAGVRMLRDSSGKVDALLDDELGDTDEDHFAESAAISVRNSPFRGARGVTTAFLRGDVVRKPNGMWSTGPKA
ncbi:hypothetical protein [Amycolatopsis regifaucium]|uniref:Uncharacterized protein n=1 Tax=Amycolatopsis regifaucium TaxID=546365 RepID=A0A154MI42_9PSEU|nr:hypothetical protein [Amycolatopsis regifaucium]KZB83803.1 hypothetical protein AVL48_34985 [Amycolatopsis regifaucium]OKA06756.1 hypothetical protein ATP06_0219635 [Amycolatopsis regifaucium]SFH26100.1 hypothetical protein SAMN04489731_103213 [Amycolatopsis regifaucium]